MDASTTLLEFICCFMTHLSAQVSNLSSGLFYQFRVFAANVVGVGKPSETSEAFLCEKWTMPEPGDEQMSDLWGSNLNKDKSWTSECVSLLVGSSTKSKQNSAELTTCLMV